ncbi:hypothetical protein BKA80DRAFT_70646 [Phyllosticta citrichinensis]
MAAAIHQCQFLRQEWYWVSASRTSTSSTAQVTSRVTHRHPAPPPPPFSRTHAAPVAIKTPLLTSLHTPSATPYALDSPEAQSDTTGGSLVMAATIDATFFLPLFFPPLLPYLLTPAPHSETCIHQPTSSAINHHQKQETHINDTATPRRRLSCSIL